jgi:hypothetical protein
MISKLTQINQDVKLSIQNSIEVLNTWLELYDYLEAGGFSNKQMHDGLLKVAASMYVIADSGFAPAIYRLNKAKELAKQGKSLREIKHYISEAVWILTK